MQTITQSPDTAVRLYDPIDLSLKLEKNVIQGNARKYLRFGTTNDYHTGIASGYAVGCNLRCNFCGSHETRDNEDSVRTFYSPEDVFEILTDIISANPRIDKLRITDGEPTVGFAHLLGLLELTEKSDMNIRFIVETNGMMIGNDPDYAKELSKFKKIFIRVSLKAGTPEAYSKKTGANAHSFYLPFQAIRYLREYNADFGVSAMSADPRFMDPLERISLITELGKIDPRLVLNLEEEIVILFPTALKRLENAGWKPNGHKLPFYFLGPLKKYAQFSYYGFSSLTKQRFSLGYTLKNISQLKHGI